MFVALLGIVAVAIAWYAPRYHQPGRGTAVYLAVYNLALLACLAVLAAGGVVTFLVAWETMSLLCYLLILRHPRSGETARGAFWFLALSEIGFVLIVAAFVILSTKTHATELDLIAARAHLVGGGWRAAAYLLALAGFGFKAGLVPLHVWLPEAHPVAPADGSAFLSGLVVKLGAYGIALFAFRLLPVGGAWPGLVTMAAGAVTAAIGILYALNERDIKRFLAYSTIENIGIIVTAFGAAMIFRAYRQPALWAFLLLAGPVPRGQPRQLQDAAVPGGRGGRARDRDQGHGPARRAGAPAAAQRGDHVRRHARHRRAAAAERVRQRVADLPGPVPGLPHRQPPDRHPDRARRRDARADRRAGHLRVRPRLRHPVPRHAAHQAGRAAAREAGQPVAGPALLAVACVALAVGAPVMLAALSRAVAHGHRGDAAAAAAARQAHRHPGPHGLLRVLADLPGRVPGRRDRRARADLPGRAAAGRERSVPVWDGGMVSFRPRMQYSAMTFSAPTRVTFDALYRPSVSVHRASDDPAGRSGPVHYETEVTPVFERYLYRPVIRAVEWLADLVRPLQSGDVNLYLFYVFLAILLAYLLGAV